MKRTCSACYRPYRGAASSAILVGGSATRRALVCSKCAAGALLVVVEVGALEEQLGEQLEAERRAATAEKKRFQRARKKREPVDAINDLLESARGAHPMHDPSRIVQR